LPTTIATVTIDATLRRDRKLHPPKTNGSRATLALPQITVEALSEHLAAYDVGSDDLVFTTPTGKPLDYNRFRVRVFVPAAESIGRPDVTFQSLRHSAGAILQHHGEHLQVIQRMMRHEDIRTSLNTYGHMSAGISEQAATAVDKAVSLARVPILRPQDQNRVAQLRP
jgi:integrase